MLLVEFAYSNSYHESIGMAPYEPLYGRKYRTTVCWNIVGERKLQNFELIVMTTAKVKLIRDRLKAAHDRRKSHADTWKRALKFDEGNRVVLKISPWKGVIYFQH